jgi:hypothetical protein
MAYAAVAARCIGVPALAVTRFEALAHERPGKRRCLVLPGFRGEKYYQIYNGIRPVGAPVWAQAVPPLELPIVEGDPTALQLLAPAARWLASKRRPAFQPLYLKPAGYERKKT